MSSKTVFELAADLELYIHEIELNKDSYDTALATCTEIKREIQPFFVTMPATSLIIVQHIESIEARILRDRG